MHEQISAITAAFPHLAGDEFTTSHAGWDSLAVMAGGMVFKFPKHAQAAERLRQEIRVLSILRPRVQMALPDLVLHDEGDQAFSSHRMIAGEHLLAAQYEVLAEHAKARLAHELAQFFSDVHAIDQKLWVDAGVSAIAPWPSVNDMRSMALPLLPEEIRAECDAILNDFAALPPDPHGSIFGMFDCHGWNMAFDHHDQRLNGLYDFGDSGFGPLHLDFMHSSLISADLTWRVMTEYESLTGRTLDRSRMRTLIGTHRLMELAKDGSNPEMGDWLRGNVEQWLIMRKRLM